MRRCDSRSSGVPVQAPLPTGPPATFARLAPSGSSTTQDDTCSVDSTPSESPESLTSADAGGTCVVEVSGPDRRYIAADGTSRLIFTSRNGARFDVQVPASPEGPLPASKEELLAKWPNKIYYPNAVGPREQYTGKRYDFEVSPHIMISREYADISAFL